MIKLIKLCFACCLTFRATFVEAIIIKEEAYEALKDFDAEFWRDVIYPYFQNQLVKNQWIAQNASKSLDSIRKDGLTELFDPDYENSGSDFRNAARNIDFLNASMLDVISSFYQILQCKVDSRDKEYETNYVGNIRTVDTTEKENCGIRIF